MDILKVDGVALPAPHSYTVTLNDLDSADTGRTEDGVAKISVQWKALSTADCAAILNATAPDQFTVQYFFGQTRTAQMYAGTRTTQLRAAREGQAVWEVGVELVEF